jgi:hypothetical protein
LIDDAFRFRRHTRGHCPIGLLDAAALEQLAEAGQRLAMATQHQAAAGVAVETMGQGRGMRQAEAQTVEILLEIGPTARPGMDRQAGGLVDDQAEPVAIEQTLQQLGFAHQSPGFNPPVSI